MTVTIGRRKLLVALGGAAATWPLTARAQQPAMPVIGFLNAASADGYRPMVAAFRQGLQRSGYVEGQSVLMEYRWAESQHDRLPTMVAERRHSVPADGVSFAKTRPPPERRRKAPSR